MTSMIPVVQNSMPVPRASAEPGQPPSMLAVRPAWPESGTVVGCSRVSSDSPPADHLELVRVLIEAGQFEAAGELLDAVWHPEPEEKPAWCLRIWLLAGEGRVLEALKLARMTGPMLPGSAAGCSRRCGIAARWRTP